MAPVMIRTIIIGAELSFFMAGRWTHDATRSTGSRSGMVHHFLATRGTYAPTIPMGKQCWPLPTAVLSRQEMASPITSPDMANRSTLLRRFRWKQFDLGGGQFAYYMHLQPGSLRVKEGDRVR